MSKTTKNQVFGLLMFIVFGVGAFSGLYYLVGNPPADAGEMAALESGVMGDGAEVLAWKKGAKIFLKKDRRTVVGDTVLVYRGLDDTDAVRIDVTIPELDPQTHYRMRIPVPEGRKGFRMARQQYRLLSANRSGVRLKMES